MRRTFHKSDAAIKRWIGAKGQCKAVLLDCAVVQCAVCSWAVWIAFEWERKKRGRQWKSLGRWKPGIWRARDDEDDHRKLQDVPFYLNQGDVMQIDVMIAHSQQIPSQSQTGIIFLPETIPVTSGGNCQEDRSSGKKRNWWENWSLWGMRQQSLAFPAFSSILAFYFECVNK